MGKKTAKEMVSQQIRNINTEKEQSNRNQIEIPGLTIARTEMNISLEVFQNRFDLVKETISELIDQLKLSSQRKKV